MGSSAEDVKALVVGIRDNSDLKAIKFRYWHMDNDLTEKLDKHCLRMFQNSQELQLSGTRRDLKKALHYVDNMVMHSRQARDAVRELISLQQLMGALEPDEGKEGPEHG